MSLLPHAVFAQSGPSCGKLNDIFGATPGGSAAVAIFTPGLCTASDFLLWILNILFTFAAGAATLVIVIGGYMYFASAGSAESAEKGKAVIKNALVGLVVVMTAFTMVNIAARFIKSGTGNGSSGTTTPTTPSGSTTNPSGGSTGTTNPGTGNGGTTVTSQMLSLPAGSFTNGTDLSFPSINVDGSAVTTVFVSKSGSDYEVQIQLSRICDHLERKGSNIQCTDENDAYIKSLKATAYSTIFPSGKTFDAFEFLENDLNNVTYATSLKTPIPASYFTKAKILENNKKLIDGTSDEEYLSRNMITFVQLKDSSGKILYGGTAPVVIPLSETQK